jgi:outer membrane protein TolC
MRVLAPASLVALLVAIALLSPMSAGATPPAPADTLRLSLPDAVARALTVSEEIRAAEANLALAGSRVTQSRAQVLPQLTAGVRYTRQLASIFEGTSAPAIDPFEPDTLASLEQRVRDLEEALPNAALSGLGSLFGDLPFGRENTWVASLDFSQKVYQGGTLLGAIRAAHHVRNAAAEALADSRTDIALSIQESFLAALLGDRLVEIASLALEQAERQLVLVRLRHEVGRLSDFDLLQAEVQRDNQRPPLVEAENARAVAYLNLKRLVNVPPATPLALAGELLDEGAPLPELEALDREALAGEAVRRPGVRSVEEAVAARQHGVKIAAGGRWPEVSLFATYSQQAFPADFFPRRKEWREDFLVGLRLNLNVFDGFLTRGQIDEAKAQLRSDQEELAILREARRVEVELRAGEFERARADLQSRQQTVRWAKRVHELAALRYEEGAANLFDVADVRIAEQIARINEARARYDLHVALARLEKLTGRPLLSTIAGEPGKS